jgi:NADH:ubiquinone oxidoreductase subunit 5 (subunit L)/multisubunit Na+/H+ antiporter MnhA subunit
MALAVTTIVLGFIGMSAPGRGSSIAHFLALSAHEQQALSGLAVLGLLTVSTLLPVTAILIARRSYRREPTMDLHLAERWPDAHGLLRNLYYFDELYATTVVSGVFTTARGLLRFEARALNVCVNALGWTVQIAGWLAYMFEKHVADRIADSIVDAVAWMHRKLVRVKIF